MDGGMIGPKIEEIEEIAVANSSGYPDFFIAGIVMPPMAEAVATPEPEIAPNSVEDKTVTTPKLPLICPINAFAMLISFSVILRDIPCQNKKRNCQQRARIHASKEFLWQHDQRHIRHMERYQSTDSQGNKNGNTKER